MRCSPYLLSLIPRDQTSVPIASHSALLNERTSLDEKRRGSVTLRTAASASTSAGRRDVDVL